MTTLQQDIDSFSKLLEQKGYNNYFKTPYAEGSLRNCLKYFNQVVDSQRQMERQQENGITPAYFVATFSTITQSKPAAEKEDVTKAHFRIEYKEGQGIRVTDLRTERMQDDDVLKKQEVKIASNLDIPSKKAVNEEMRLPSEKQNLTQRLRIKL